MSELHQMPSQTVGPFFGYSLHSEGGTELLPAHSRGTIRCHRAAVDGAGEVVPDAVVEIVPDAVVEIWQANAAGAVVAERGSLTRDGYTFTGFGGAAVDSWGHFSLTTITPGAMRERSAPYILVAIFARELLQHPFTRAYFGESDSFLAGLGDRAATLIATADGESSYRVDIHLQGESETVFIDYGVDAGA